jgi:hypothetical protein
LTSSKYLVTTGLLVVLSLFEVLTTHYHAGLDIVTQIHFAYTSKLTNLSSFNFDKKERFDNYGTGLTPHFFSTGTEELLTPVVRPTATSVILEDIEGFIGLKSKKFLLSQT